MVDRGKDYDPALGESSPPVNEKVYLKDIVESTLYPDIVEYLQILDTDANKDDALGPLSLAELERAKFNLADLKTALATWIKSPSSFSPVERRENGDLSKQNVMSVKLRFPGDPVDLPLEPGKAQLQLGFYLDLRKRSGETKSQAIRGESLKGHSPQQVLRDIEQYRSYDARLLINTIRAWVHPRSERVHIEPGSGIELVYRISESVASRGVTFVGNTPHYSDVIAPSAMGIDQFLFLESLIIGDYNLSRVFKR
ncbi:hypothetical protein HY045_01545 [Candidatus Woesebacteria bacterium]|nr:hypothetical protein [Candidatus Woesebacteria bacterium]